MQNTSDRIVIQETRNAPILLARTREDHRIRDIPPHHHDRGEIFGTFRGLMSVGTEQGRWVVPSTHAAWIPPRHTHAMRSHSPFSGWLVFIAESVCGTFPAQPCTVVVSDLLREAILRAAAWSDGILNEEQTHIATVICDEIRNLPRGRPGLPLPSDQRLLRITRAIADNPADNRRLEDWAHWGGISTRTLSRRFIDETGFSFTEWRQRVRLMRALELLAAKIPVTTVAFDLGYETVSAFIAMFHRFFGVTPARYIDELRRNTTLNPKSSLLEKTANIGHPHVRTASLSSNNIFAPE